MRNFRFYLNFTPTIGTITLEHLQTVHYIVHVLRLKVGAQITLFNGTGFEFNAIINAISKNKIDLLIKSKQSGMPESKLTTHLGQVISRGERMDFVLQKACELGVTEITPLFSVRSEAKLSGTRLKNKLEHWQQVLISAAEQSGRSVLPILNEPQPLQSWLTTCQELTKIVLQPQSPSFGQISAKQSLALLIGSEGGFTADEILIAKNHNFIGASLGPRILRTETAPIVALAIAQYLWGDF